jgi:hypothetical protein
VRQLTNEREVPVSQAEQLKAAAEDIQQAIGVFKSTDGVLNHSVALLAIKILESAAKRVTSVANDLEKEIVASDILNGGIDGLTKASDFFTDFLKQAPGILKGMQDGK